MKQVVQAARVAVPEQDPRHAVPGEGLPDLLGGPAGRRVRRDVHVEDAPPGVREHHEDEQHAERRRRHREEVARGELRGVAGEEGPPRLRRLLRATNSCEVLGHGRLRDREPELLELAVYPRGSSQRIRGVHLSDQGAKVAADTGPTGPARRDLQRQAKVKARRCQRTTVSGVTIRSARRQFGQARESRTHRSRSTGRSRGPCGA